MTNAEHELPPSWAWTTLGDVAELVGGGTPSRERPEYFAGKNIWLTPTEIPKNRVSTLSDSRERISDLGIKKSSARVVPPGSVLMTSRATIGYVAIAGAPVTTNQGFANFICGQSVHNAYLAYWLWSQRDAFIEQATGTTFKEITKSKLRPIRFPLAPLPEQRRIVAKIEELFSRLDAGVAALKRVQAALKRYKASVLKAACEGRLVPQDPSDEPADVLLARILAERRAMWEADLRAKGKDPKKAEYQEPPGPSRDAGSSPERWAAATVRQLTSTITSGSRDWSKYYGEGTGVFLMAQNVRPGRLDLTYKQLVNPPPNDRDRKRSQVLVGDLLVTIVGANTGDVCRVAQVLPEHFVCQSVALMRPVEATLAPYMELYLTSDENGQRQYREFMYGAGRPHLSFEQLEQTIIGVPPLEEQRRIVAEVERRMSLVSELERSLGDNLARAARLRQSILARAFSGQLVPLDPTDEPADRLLAQIQVGRGEAPEARAAKPGRRKAGVSA